MLDDTSGLGRSDPGRFYAIQRPVIAKKRAAVDAYKNYIISTSPFAYWPLNEKTGTTATEVIGGLNGTHTGLTLGQIKGKFVAPYYDGSAAYTDLYSAGLNTGFNRAQNTLCVWVWFDFAWSETVNRMALNIQNTANSDIFYFQKGNSSGAFTFICMLGGVLKSVALSGQSWTQWAMLTMVTDKTTTNTMKAYINGAQVGTTQTALGTPAGTALESTKCLVGQSATSGTMPFLGWIAHAIIYNSALSDADVLALYNQGV